MSLGFTHAPAPCAALCGTGRVAEGPGVYRPRHPERTAFYRVAPEHLERYFGVYEERFEPRYGPLRSVVPRAARRGLFERDRRLLGLLTRGADEAICRSWAEGARRSRCGAGHGRLHPDLRLLRNSSPWPVWGD